MATPKRLTPAVTSAATASRGAAARPRLPVPRPDAARSTGVRATAPKPEHVAEKPKAANPPKTVATAAPKSGAPRPVASAPAASREESSSIVPLRSVMPTLTGIGVEDAPPAVKAPAVPVAAPSSVRVRDAAATIVEELDASALLDADDALDEAPATVFDPSPPPSIARAMSVVPPTRPSAPPTKPPVPPSVKPPSVKPASARVGVPSTTSVAPPPSSAMPSSVPSVVVASVPPRAVAPLETAATEPVIPVDVEVSDVLPSAPAIPVVAAAPVPAPALVPEVSLVVAKPQTTSEPPAAQLGAAMPRQTMTPLRLVTPVAAPPAASPAPPPPPGDAHAHAPRPSLSDPMDVLFDAAYELCFLESSLDGVRYAAQSAGRALAARAALVHVLDGKTGELVTVAAEGEGAAALLGGRHESDDWLISAACFKGRPITMEYGGEVSGRPMPRHAAVGVQRNVVVVPVVAWGRTLAVLEVVDGQEAMLAGGRGENALAYLAGRVAEYLGTHDSPLAD